MSTTYSALIYIFEKIDLRTIGLPTCPFAFQDWIDFDNLEEEGSLRSGWKVVGCEFSAFGFCVFFLLCVGGLLLFLGFFVQKRS